MSDTQVLFSSVTGDNEQALEDLLNKMNDYARRGQLGSRVKNQAYNLKEVILHVWDAGAAAQDIATSLETVATTDVIVVNALDSAAVTAVKGTRTGANAVTLDTIGNGADAEVFQILVYHKVVAQS